jgi:DNA-binding transcriptional regulator of glucitol operon
MSGTAISMDQIVALIAVALMLLLAWRNISSFQLGSGRKLGMAMIWIAVFGLLAVIAGQFGM